MLRTLPLTRRTAPARSGITLLEVLVAASVFGALFATTAGILQLTVQLHHRSRDRLADVDSLDRLSRQFRADVRSATAGKLVEQVDTTASLELTLPTGGTIVYHITSPDAPRVLRLVRTADAVTAREGYVLAEWTPAALEITKQSPRHVRLLFRRPSSTTRTPADLEIQALLGARNQAGKREPQP